MMAGVPGGRISPRGVLVTSSIAVFLIALNTTAINAAVNALADDLGMDTSTLAWALNAYILAVATLVLPAGRLGDILGHALGVPDRPGPVRRRHAADRRGPGRRRC